MRWVTRLLLVVLLPVVILATTDAARAATAWGPPVGAAFTLDPGGMMEVDCNLVGYWATPDTGDPYVTVRGDCAQAWGSEANADYLGSLTASGGCSLVGGPVSKPDVAWSIDLHLVGSPDPGTCGITEGEAHICRDSYIGDTDCREITFPWALGSPPAATAPTACVWGDPGVPLMGAVYDGGSSKWVQDVSVGVAGKTPVGVGYTTTVWRAYAVKKDGSVYVYGGVEVSSLLVGQPISIAKMATELAGTGYSQSLINIVGFGISHQIDGAPTKSYGWSNSKVAQGGPLGRNDPGKCDFYWGEKFSDLAGSDVDEPTGVLTPFGGVPPEGDDPEPTDVPVTPEEDDGCGAFSIWDPTTYASGGICAVVSAVMGLWNTVKSVLSVLSGLAAAILAGLGDVLTALFVPSPGSWGVDDLVAQMEDRPPGSVIVGLSDAAQGVGDGFAGSGGCGVLADFSDEDMDASLTCADVETFPGYGALYALVQLGIFAMTGLGLFKMFSGLMEKS